MGVSERERDREKTEEVEICFFAALFHHQLSPFLARRSNVESIPKVASDDHPAGEQRYGAEKALLEFF